jgi:hypothetical protein
MMQVNAETSADHFDVGLINRPAALTQQYHWIAGRRISCNLVGSSH